MAWISKSWTAVAGVLVSSCFGPAGGWRAEVAMQTSQLGYRNWIVISEASFPAFSRHGTRQINSYESVPVVLDEVLKTLEQTEHVRPKVYMTRELRSVDNDFAPGVDQLRSDLGTSLHGHEVIELEQDSLITLIQDAQRSFDVLVVRTNTALPYSSIFIELEPGYWDGESETRLRDEMNRQRMDRLASPVR
ncbi:D-ribose pyranose/furanose isomerase RbsD [Haloferula luteola]|uniref:D-ribose pyranose/furanose isomerase RbsD n=1 Tax=Haloferula luteola TaxID=595692 RepID=A0A840VER9_9BACT|nr:hypothetical protein [Haloferula luteola]MBB5352329.1 D-ribose pyranose/furanose isomerase RbsD [Haloferula luteola]